MKEKNIAIVLSAGKGTRMHSETAKQYLPIKERPVIYYSLKTFQESSRINEIVLVTGAEDIEYCKKEVVEKYGLSKVSRILPGGKERYDSVYEGLKACENCKTVYIHDGARPLVSEEILTRAEQGVQETGACIVGMPVKDTIKISDEKCFCRETPDRRSLWQVQTPQVFSYSLVYGAYTKMMEAKKQGKVGNITDDAMVVESMTDVKVKLVEGSYTNIKITTPEDLKIAELFLDSASA